MIFNAKEPRMKQVFFITMIALLFTNTAFSQTLHTARLAVIASYVDDLQHADYKHIATLFDKNGYVISTSKGKVNAKEFFYNFLPNVTHASTVLKHRFHDGNSKVRYAARFHLAYQLKDGDSGEGEYMDEFVFGEDSALLDSVAMFENLKMSS